jgi:hypothetical protein
LVKENQKKFPDFLPNQLIYGALEAAVGTIPKNYKWLASLLWYCRMFTHDYSDCCFN